MIRLYYQSAVFFVILQVILVQNSFAQSTGNILIISDTEANIFVDGEEFGSLSANKPRKLEILEGEHYLQIITTGNNQEKNEILVIEPGKQKVLKFKFGEAVSNKNRIAVTDIDFNIPGIIMASAQDGFESPTYRFAFEKGDEIIINLDMTNIKGTNVIEVFTYPDRNIKYSNDSFQDLKDLKIKVTERSIYGFSFASNHAFDRDARLMIERIPENENSIDFNTTVTWQATYHVIEVQKPQKFYINSGSNASFKGGKSRITIPLKFPENTFKWYYTFSASRDESQIESVSNSINLVSELVTLIDQTGILSFGIDQLTQPPGSDYCDIYLIDHNNSSLFKSKEPFTYLTEGSRENFKSGVVEVECCINLPTYLGFKNPDNLHGIHFVVEVASIVKEEGWVMHHKD